MTDVVPAPPRPKGTPYRPVRRELPQIEGIDPFGATYKGKLTDELQHTLCDIIAWGGLNIEQTCRAVGIGVKTYYQWLEWGRQRRTGKFVAFLEAVEAAKSVFELRATDAIATAGFIGATTTVVKETTELDPDTGDMVVVKSEKTTTVHPGDVKALQFLLKVRAPERYADKLVTENKNTTERVTRVEFSFVETGVLDGGAGSVIDAESVPVLDTPADPLDPDD